MHMAGISGVVSRAARQHHQRNQQTQNNGIHAHVKPAGVHNAATWTSKNAVNGIGRPALPTRNVHRPSSGGLTGVPGSLVDLRRSMSGLIVAGYDQNPPPDHRSRQLSAYRRWLSRNKVTPGTVINGYKQRASGIFQQKYRPGQKYRESLSASVLLYMGIGMIVVGLVITFVGVGDNAFHTLELQLIGPTLIAVGFVVCGVRVLICAFANKCDLCDQRIEDPMYDEDDVDGSRRKSNMSQAGSVRSWRLSSSSTKHLVPTTLEASAAATADVGTRARTKPTSQSAAATSSATSSSSSSSSMYKHRLHNSDEDLVAAELARQSSTPSIPSSILFSANVTPQPHDFSVVAKLKRPASSVSSMSSDFQEVQLMNALSEDGDENFKRKNRNPEIIEDGVNAIESAPRIGSGTDDEQLHIRRHRLKNGVILNPSSLTS